MSELREDEQKRQRKQFEHQQKIEDDEFNDLLDNYHYQIDQKRKALKYLEDLENEYNNLLQHCNAMQEKYNLLQSDHVAMATSLRTSQSEASNLKQVNANLLQKNLNSEQENLQLSRQHNELVEKYNAHIKTVEKSAQTIGDSLKIKQRIKVNAEQTFSLIQNKEANEKLEAMMLSKVAYTQNLVLKKIIAEQIQLGNVSTNDFPKFELSVLREEDRKDVARQGITYEESVDWLKIHSPSNLAYILNSK